MANPLMGLDVLLPMSVQLAMDGVDVNEINAEDGCAPIHLAAAHGHATNIALLMTHGGDINLQNESGATALHCATLNSRFAAAQLLVDMGTTRTLTLPPHLRKPAFLPLCPENAPSPWRDILRRTQPGQIALGTHAVPRHNPPPLHRGASRRGARLAGQDGVYRAGTRGLQWPR